MSISRCLACGQFTDSVAESGLCVTCRGASDETRRLDQEAGTRTHDAPAAGTQPYGAESRFGVLPPGGYRYEEVIGSGGMGVVWRAVRVSTDQVVAIKKLKPECFTAAMLRRFVAEARTLAAVRHPNVVRLDDFVPDPADPFLVLEFVPGESLAHHLRTAGPLHPDRAARLIGEAARGVQAAHDAGVIHRDLKPGNLLLTPGGLVKVVDFGLSKQVAGIEELGTAGPDGGGSTLPSESLTGTGRLAGGTPGFMAPEQVDESFGPVGPPADVWGLGACLHTLLIGKPPFPPGGQNLELVTALPLVPPHELNPAIPADLSAIVAKCLQKKAADRYPTATALAADLDRFLSRESTEARPHTRLTRAWRRVRRVPKVAVVAVTVAVLAVAVGGALALVPNWLKETPEAIQEGYRRDLKAGKAVTLIGETGLPRHHRATYGTPTLGTRPDGTCTFEVVGRTLVELFDDPGIDSYTVRAELQQTVSRAAIGNAIPAGEGEVGLFVAYACTPDGVGGEFTTLLALGFSDRDPNFTRTGKLEPQKVRSSAVIYFSGPNDQPDDAPVELAFAPFVPAEKRPGPWRTVEYHVTPHGFTPRWSADGAAPTPLNGPLVKPAAKEYALTQPLLDAAHPRQRLSVPRWNTRAPLGIYAHSSAVAVRNVVITPDP